MDWDWINFWDCFIVWFGINGIAFVDDMFCYGGIASIDGIFYVDFTIDGLIDLASLDWGRTSFISAFFGVWTGACLLLWGWAGLEFS